MEQQEIYEPPQLVEVGGFGELTCGDPLGDRPDRPPPPRPSADPEG